MLASFAVSAMVVWQLAGMPVAERTIDQRSTRDRLGRFQPALAFRSDPLGAVMILVVTASAR
jgi:hypothetical protein